MGQHRSGCFAYSFREGARGLGGHGRLIAEGSRAGGEKGLPLPQGADSPVVESGERSLVLSSEGSQEDFGPGP